MSITYQLCFRVHHGPRKQRRTGTDWTHQMLIYDDANLFVENINTTNKNAEAVLDASSEVDLEKSEKSKYMFTSRHQTAGQNHNIKVQVMPADVQREVQNIYVYLQCTVK
jgi:hypothetical protein